MGRLCSALGALVCLAGFSAQEAGAQTYCIRPPGGNYGSENGSSWNNAYEGWPSSFVRGAVYYVADGNYSGKTFKTPNSGSQIVTIKKATVEDHGASVGWDNAMGDGEALFTGQFVFTTAYWDFDGQKRNADWKTGYGFRVDASAAKGFRLYNGGDRVTVRYTEIAGRGDDGDGSPANDLVYINADADFFKIQYCYLHDAGRTQFLMRQADDGIIEYCYVARNESVSAQHSEAISSDIGTDRWTVRHCVWEDIEGTGIIVFNGEGWELYGNLCFQTGDPNYWGVTNGGFCTWTGDPVTNAKIHNNTFIDISGNAGISFDARFASGNVARNNMWYQCSTVRWGGVDHDYGWFYRSETHSEPNLQYGTGDPFVDSANHDYRLAVNTEAGDSSLGAPYNMDMYETQRGADGNWDRGAVEQILDQPLPTFTPAPPTHTPTITPVPPTPTITNTPGPPTDTPLPPTPTHTVPSPTPTHTVPSPTPTNTLVEIGDALVGMWGFNEGSGAMAHDDSGFGNDAQLMGDPYWIQGEVNGALELDGVGDYVDCGNNPSLRQLSDTFSISLFVKGVGRGESDYIIDKNGGDVGFYLRTHPDNTIIFKLDDGSDHIYLNSNDSTPTDGEWHHLAVVVNGRFSAKLYLDGVVQSGGDGFLPSVDSLVNDVALAIGAKTVFAPENYQGAIDDVRIYNQALSDQEIIEIRDSWIVPDTPAPEATATSSPSPANTVIPPTATATSTQVPPSPTNTAIPPTATHTPVPPTATATSTQVPPSPTPTNTAIPPTATHSSVPPTATNTPVPPMATLTPSFTPTSIPIEVDRISVPEAIDDLKAYSRYLPGRYKIRFTSPDGDPDEEGRQTPTAYDVRYSLTPIETLEDFLYGQKVPNRRSPKIRRGRTKIIINHLPSGPNHFSARVKGPEGYSAPSNSDWATLYDVTPPEGLESKAYANHMIFLGGENADDSRELVVRGSDSSWDGDEPNHRDNSTSLEIRAFGERFLSSPVDSGGWLTQNSEAHNVILVDDPTDGPQDEWMSAGPSRSTIASIQAHVVTPRLDYGLLSSQLDSPNDVGAYSNKVQLDRHVVFPDHRFFIVFDDLKSADGESHNYGWVGHCFGTLDLSVPRMALFTKPSGRTLAVGFLAPSVAIWNHSLTHQVESEGGEVEVPYIVGKTAGQDVQFLTLLAPLDVGEAAPSFEPIEVENASAGRVSVEGAEFLVVCQKGNREITIDGKLTTNSKFAIAKVVEGDLDYVFTVDHSGWLWWNGKKVFTPGKNRSFLYQSKDPKIDGPSVTTIVD